MIDLHLHTTASDGRLSPAELVARAAGVGLTTIAVTDHDTVFGLADARPHATAANIALVPGIEITSVTAGRDVHVLGYFIDETDAALLQFLQRQRGLRIERVHEIGKRLEALGMPLAVEPLLEAAAARPGASVGRPVIARALVDAGYVTSMQEAFDRFLAVGQAAFVPRLGCAPAEVVAVIHAAGGVASLAHPGLTRQPEIIEPLAAAGLDALEVYHSDHTPEMQAEARSTAERLKLSITGGSDYHGDDKRRPIGGVTLPQAAFDDLVARANARRGRADAPNRGSDL